MNSADTFHSEVDHLRQKSLSVGLAALACCVVAGFFSPKQFFRSYLLAYVYWVGFPLGCAAILMLHHLVGGTWGFGIRRLLESATETIRLMAGLVIPILFGARFIFSWADPGAVRADPLLQYKHPYLNIPFFVGRTIVYFAIWVAVIHFLNKWSLQQDVTADPDLTRRLQNLSAPGLILYGVTVTYASVDWVMSLEPRWYSTIYGLLFMVVQALAAMAFVTLAVIVVSKREHLAGLISPLLYNDYGNLLLTFTMLWGYLSFSQYLIVWSGNLQDEIPWYVVRSSGGWAWVALALIIFHFFVPFALLLSRFIKRRRNLLGAVAAILLFISLIDVFWLTVPAFERRGPEFHWMDLLATIGIGGVWTWAFTSRLKGKPLVPLHDPRLGGVLHG